VKSWPRGERVTYSKGPMAHRFWAQVEQFHQKRANGRSCASGQLLTSRVLCDMRCETNVVGVLVTAVSGAPVTRIARGQPAKTKCQGARIWRWQKPILSANQVVRTLDQCLYAWLLESDDRRSERAFSSYFSVAFPAVVRYLARLSRWDLTQLEDLAQDALFKFFERAGRRRRDAAESIKDALERIRPLALGPFHERQVQTWAKDVSSFRESAMHLRNLMNPIEQDEGFRTQNQAIASRIPSLKKQGCHLLGVVQSRVNWTLEPQVRAECGATIESVNEQVVDDVDLSEPTKQFADQLVAETRARTTRALAAEAQFPGALLFIESVSGIVGAIPLLRIPTNGFLFDIALTLYLDEYKRRGRRKRGGSLSASGGTKDEDRGASPTHPLESSSLDLTTDFNGEVRLDETNGNAANASVGVLKEPGADPTSQYENEELLEKFYIYLRKPLDEAIEAHAIAQTRGRAMTEQKRMESVATKFERTVAVLSLVGEGYTQDQVADQLGLSRNQVKYVIEIVQEAYTHFAMGGRSVSGLSGEREQSHVN
jgi:DNA-directed RNA polymerase specialized sigma24 family protein